MLEIVVKVHRIAEDGLPNMDALVGRVGFIWDGALFSGWPLDVDEEGEVDWEANEAWRGSLSSVTHWLEFPDPFWEVENA
jgi:hypothetical protein